MTSIAAMPGNTGPMANGTPALDTAKAQLASAKARLANVGQLEGDEAQLMLVYLDAMRSSRMLSAAAADPRVNYDGHLNVASENARQAASTVGQVIKALRRQTTDAGFAAADPAVTTRRLKAAAAVLDKAVIGANTPTKI